MVQVRGGGRRPASKRATRSNAVRRVREMRARPAWYRVGSFLAAECIYATALLLRAGRTASRSVVRRVFALSDAVIAVNAWDESNL